MRNNSNQDYFLKIYEALIKKANNKYKKHKRDKLDIILLYLKAACWIQYTFSKLFTDSRIENLLIEISNLIPKIEFQIDDDCYIFYDDFLLDNMGLSQQYLRAICNTGKHIILITQRDLRSICCSDIRKEVALYDNLIVETIEYSSYRFLNVVNLYNLICKYRPAKIFIQMQPHAVEAVTAFYALPKSIIKYQIDLTDHAFWVGAGVFDYSFVFRSYGYHISLAFRGLNPEQILLLPYYPICNNSNYEGLPISTESKFVFFSGGAFHKIISPTNVFINFIKTILDKYPDSVFLFAGSGNINIFNDILNNEAYINRFALIGQRHDLPEVFKRVSLYVNTFPFGGGLMSQIAAKSRVPIVSLKGNDYCDIEDIVCQKGHVNITSDNITDLLTKIDKLKNNEQYRIDYSSKLRECIIDQPFFDNTFNVLISNNTNILPIADAPADFYNVESQHTRVMQDAQNLSLWLIKYLKFDIFVICPRVLMIVLKSLLNKSGFRRIYEYLYRFKKVK